MSGRRRDLGPRPVIVNPIVNFGGIRLKLIGTFALKEHPADPSITASAYHVDRWTPVGDRDRDMISALRGVDGGWISAYDDVWYGFEGEGMITDKHIYEYYNLIVIRPSVMPPKMAVKVAEAKEFLT